MRATHSFTTIKKVLFVLRDNNFNLAKTSREQKVSVALIKKWRGEYANEVWDTTPVIPPDPLKIAKAAVIKEGIGTRHKVGKLVDVVVKVLLDRLESPEQLAKMTVKDLTLLLEKTVPYILPKFEDGNGEGEKNYNSVFNTFVSNTYNQLIESGNEQRNASIKGTPKKLSSRNE